MKFDNRIPKKALIKEAQRAGERITRSWSKKKVWSKVPKKSKEILYKRYCTIRGGGLESLVKGWVSRKLKCKKVFLNRQIKGKLRFHEVDVTGLKEGFLGSGVILIECKGIKSKISDNLLRSIIHKFEDIARTGRIIVKDGIKENKIGDDIKEFIIVTSSGYTPAALRLANEKSGISGGFVSTYPLKLYEYFGGKYKLVHKGG